jgi:hypothetical protein
MTREELDKTPQEAYDGMELVPLHQRDHEVVSALRRMGIHLEQRTCPACGGVLTVDRALPPEYKCSLCRARDRRTTVVCDEVRRSPVGTIFQPAHLGLPLDDAKCAMVTCLMEKLVEPVYRPMPKGKSRLKVVVSNDNTWTTELLGLKHLTTKDIEVAFRKV